MKKTNLLKVLMAFVCVLFAGFALASCGDDDDPETPDKKATHAEYKYIMNVSQATLDIVNVSITYTDGNGTEQTEQVTSPTWSKTVTCKSLPANFVRTVTLTPKITPDASTKYDIVVEKYGYECKTLNAKGEKVDARNYATTMSSKGLKGDDLADGCTRIGRKLSFPLFVSVYGDIGGNN